MKSIFLSPVFFKYSLLTFSMLIIAGCNSALTQHEKQVTSFNKLKEDAEEKPSKYRIEYTFEQQHMINLRLTQGLQEKRAGNIEGAILLFQQVLDFDQNNATAKQEIKLLKQRQQNKPLLELAQNTFEKGNSESALIILKEILQSTPDYEDAISLRTRILEEKNRRLINPPQMNEKLTQRISLEFKSAPVQSVLEVLSEHSGINFILDKDAKLDQNTTIYAKNTTVQEALNMIMRTSGLGYKTLNSNTFLIFQNTAEKRKVYEEMITRSFYLGSADAKNAQEMISKLYEPKSMYFDDRLKMLIIRDNTDVLASIEQSLQAYDLPTPEVVLDIEVLEVNRDTLLGLGIDFPNQISVKALNDLGDVGKFTLNQVKNLNSNNLGLVVADPLAALNFKQTSNKSNLLANPRIRVKSREEASFLIGDKVPVITSTIGENSNFLTQNVNYLDVGLKVNVKPEVNKDNQVQINIKMEVSNIAKEIREANGVVAYQIGTRNASTILQLNNGETQMLAGLIRDDSKTSATHLPGIGKIPLLGRLFSNTSDSKNKSEIVLLITPRIVRPFELPAPHIQEFISGTLDQVTTRPLRLNESAKYTPNAESMLSQMGVASPLSASVTNTVEVADKAAQTAKVTPPATTSYGGAPASAQFQLSGPSTVTPGQEFTVALIQNTPAFESLKLDVLHPESWEMSRIVLVAPSAKIEQTKLQAGTQLNFGATPAHQGPAALLTFKIPIGEVKAKRELIVEHGSIKLGDGKAEKFLTDKVIKEIQVESK